MPEVILMTAADAKTASNTATDAGTKATNTKNNYLRDINTEIQKRINGGQYMLWLPLTDLQYRTDIEGLGYVVSDATKNNIPGVNISWY